MAKVKFKMKGKNGSCKVNYRTAVEVSGEFWYYDMKDFLENREFAVIDSMVVNKDSRNKGIGTEFLKTFCETRKDKVIIVVAGLLMSEYPEAPKYNEYIKVLSELDKFFTKRGFSDINKYTKSYEYSKNVYIYTESKIGKEVFNEIKEYYNK